MNGIRCVCGAKLIEALEGKAVVFCRHCKRHVLLSGTSSVTIVDTPKMSGVA